MKQFTLKTYRTSASVELNSFYILNKGMNSGRPHPKPFCNSFTFIADSAEEMEMFYWITFAAWQGKLFHPYIKGSVIPFITLMDIRLEKYLVAGFLYTVQEKFHFYTGKTPRKNLVTLWDFSRFHTGKTPVQICINSP